MAEYEDPLPNSLPDPALDELRRAWRGLEAELPAEGLAQQDAQTRASVEWVRAAWSQLAVPEPRVPDPLPVLELMPEPMPRRPALLRLVPYAAAAAVLLALWFTQSEPSVQRSGEAARNERDASNTTDDEGPQLAALSSNHLELRSGPVRLILLKDLRTQ